MPIFRSALQRFGVDRAVSYAMAARIWQIPSGVVTTVLIALCFEAEQQGIYFLILTLTGLQALADAGLINTLLHAASHESAAVRFSAARHLHGPRRARRRLAGIYRFALRWFSVASILLVVVGIVAGAILLHRQGVLPESIAPLFIALVMAGSALALAPLVAILEGCDQVREVNRFRFFQVVTGSAAVWAGLALGAGLWTAAIAVAVQLGWEAALVGVRYRRFFVQLHRTESGDFDWRHEIWPLQWRIAVQSLVRYLAFLPILPILFDTQGPEVAGRYGMTWQVISSLMMVAYVFVRTKSPEFGRLFAEGKRDAAGQVFRRSTVGSTILLIGLVASFCIALATLKQVGWDASDQIADRFLAITTCVMFAVAVVPMHLTQCFSMVIRSQKLDPIWRVSIPACAIMAGLTAAAAWQGEIKLIPAAMLLTFSFSSVALAWMARWYDRYFRRSADETGAQVD